MANLEHVALLKKSVKKWYQWREENPEVVPELEEADLRKADLECANLEGAKLEEIGRASCRERVYAPV